MTTLLTTKYLYKSPFQIEAIGIDLPDLEEANPNRVPFRGILTRLDEPSTRPPNGSGGHKVLIPRAVAEQALPSLMGMPIDASMTLRDHNKRLVIGFITGAEIQGQDLVVVGHLLGKNFPEEVAEIKAKKAQLGMSYEIGNVEVENEQADIWTLTNLQFTGAAILERSAAAYSRTALVAHAEEVAMPGLENVEKTLGIINGRLATLQAASDAETEEAAKEHDAAAERAVAAAAAARADGDEDDAKCHDAEAQKAFAAATATRQALAQRHDEEAARLQAAGEEEAAQHHTAEAARLREADASMQAAAKAHAGQVQAAADDEEAAEEEAAQQDGLERLLAAMGYVKAGQDAEAEDEEEASVARLTRLMALAGMTYPVGPMARKKKVAAAKKHADEAEDIALLKRLMKVQQAGSLDARRQPVDLEQRRWQRKLEASVEMLTDTVNRMAKLLTDQPHGQRDLATDRHNGANGGPVRRTLAAGDPAVWVPKHQEATHEGKSLEAMDAELGKGALDNRHKMAAKLDALHRGELTL